MAEVEIPEINQDSLDYTRTGDPFKDFINKSRAEAVAKGLNPYESTFLGGLVPDELGMLPLSAKVILLNGVLIITGKGTPLNVVNAPVGSLFLRQDGGANTTLYVKESGTLSAGWVAK